MALLSVPPLTGSDPLVTAIHWPAEGWRREELRAAGRATLLLVEPAAEPPAVGDGIEDWIRLPATDVDVDTRRRALRRRVLRAVPVEVDGDGLLRRGGRWTALPDAEASVFSSLYARRGHVVARAELQSADAGRALDGTVKRLRRRLRPFGITITAVRASGLLLDIGPLPDDDATGSALPYVAYE
jgi:hypothetical protein